MAFPEEKEIRRAIIEELKNMGGTAEVKVILHVITERLKNQFPNFSDADRQGKDPQTGWNSWEHRLHSVRSRMVKAQPPELDPKSPRGIWRLPGAQPSFVTPIPPIQTLPRPMATPLQPSTGPDEIAEHIKHLVNSLLELANKQQVAPVPGHDELIKLGREIGQKLGKIVETESGPVYKHDVSWKDNKWKNPSLVIEICDKGVLDKDIQSLNWAAQNWGAKCILVTVDDKDYENAIKKLGTSTSIHVIKASDFQQLHSVVNSAGTGILKAIFGA